MRYIFTRKIFFHSKKLFSFHSSEKLVPTHVTFLRGQNRNCHVRLNCNNRTSSIILMLIIIVIMMATYSNVLANVRDERAITYNEKK